MAREYEPVVGQWYENIDENDSFRVLSVDEDAELIKIEYLDGDIEEIDVDIWAEFDLDKIEQPEGWSGEDIGAPDEEDDDETMTTGTMMKMTTMTTMTKTTTTSTRRRTRITESGCASRAAAYAHARVQMPGAPLDARDRTASDPAWPGHRTTAIRPRHRIAVRSASAPEMFGSLNP